MFNWKEETNPQDQVKTAEKLAGNLAQIKYLQAENEELWAELEGSLGEGDHSVGDFIIKFSPQTRFNASLAKEVLSEEEYNAICKLTPDSTLAKKVLGERYSEVQKATPKLRKEINRVL